MSPRLFWQIFSLEVRKTMSYRAEFWGNTALGVLAQFGVVYFLWLAMFGVQDSDTIAGYTFERMIVYYVLAILLSKIVRGQDREGAISTEIYDGGYTRYIIYPAPFLPFKFAQHLGAVTPALIQVLLFGGVAVWILGPAAFAGVSYGSLLSTLILVAVANLVHFQMRAPLEGLAFWADNVWSLWVMLRMVVSFLGGAMIPLDLFPTWATQALAWTPFPYLTYVPVKTLLGEVALTDWLFGLGVLGVWGLVLGAVIAGLWRRGDLQYTGVGI